MYCVKCGRRARDGERRCPACGMRLVTPEKLNRLLDEYKKQKNASVRQGKVVHRAKPDYAAVLEDFIVRVKDFSVKLTGSASEKLTACKNRLQPVFKKYRKHVRKLYRKTRRRVQKLGITVPKSQAKPAVNRPATIKRHKVNVHRESFAERNLRTIVAMSLLGLTLLITFLWGTISAPGMRTFASLGMGSAKGYVLLGDEYMNSGNYSRAVESYYTAINRNNSFEAAFKLARAYSYTGDSEKCVSALLYCTDNFPGRREPYVQLIRMYPDVNGRPQRIKEAIEKGNAQFSLE